MANGAIVVNEGKTREEAGPNRIVPSLAFFNFAIQYLAPFYKLNPSNRLLKSWFIVIFVSLITVWLKCVFSQQKFLCLPLSCSPGWLELIKIGVLVLKHLSLLSLIFTNRMSSEMILLFVFLITYQFYRQRIIITEYAYVQTFLIFRKWMRLKQWDVARWITSYVKLNVIAIAREIINQCKFSNNFTELPSLGAR